MKLYELSKESKALDELLNSCVDLETGEIVDSETLNELNKNLQLEISKKATSIVQVFKNDEADIEAIESEIKRLTDLKKSKVNKKEAFKNYIKINMEQMGINKLETPLGTFSLRSSVSTEIDENLIDKSYGTITEVLKFSKTDIKKKLEAGEIIIGARLSNNTSLIIK